MSLNCLITGTGRDGTTTLRVLACNLAIANKEEPDALHETNISELYNSWFRYHENDDSSEIESVLRSWTHRVESSSGHAFWLPVVAKVFGPDIALIHLKRDRAACVDSLCNNPTTGPEYHGNYVDHFHGPIRTWLPTAFYFGDMTKAEWEAAPLRERIEWYYDKTHELINQHKGLFSRYLEVRTEDLNSQTVISSVRDFINPRWENNAFPVHQNFTGLHKIYDLTVEESRRAELLFNDFNVIRAVKHPDGLFYAAGFFMNKVLNSYHSNTLEVSTFLTHLVHQIAEIAKSESKGP
jgi:hypothetical protein